MTAFALTAPYGRVRHYGTQSSAAIAPSGNRLDWNWVEDIDIASLAGNTNRGAPGSTGTGPPERETCGLEKCCPKSHSVGAVECAATESAASHHEFPSTRVGQIRHINRYVILAH